MGCEQNEINNEDLRAALGEMKTYVDITEEDLRRIYDLALRHAKTRLAAKISVSEVMTINVVSVTGDTHVDEIAKLLSEHRISGVPVVDAERRVVGIISEADILSNMGLHREHTFRDILTHIAGIPLPARKSGNKAVDLMTSPAIVAEPETGINEVAKILDEKRIKRLPVTDSEGRLVGIVSRADIIRAMGK